MAIRWIKPLAVTGAALLAGVLGYNALVSNLLSRRVAELEQERAELIEYARRLSASRRVAQVGIMEQFRDAEGRVATRLLWQEIDANGLIGRPVYLEVLGTQVYFEAFVIKFEHERVGEGDPERGASLALFRRVFGDLQTPESVPLFDSAAPGAMGASASPHEQRLWRRFWEFVDDPALAEQYGIRVAQCEAPSVIVRTGQIWEVSLDAAGGLNVKKLFDAPPLARSLPTP